MKNLFLTKTRWLVTIILLTALGSGNAWGAKDDVVYKINTATTKIGSKTTYTNYGPTDCASAQAGSTVSTASWCVTLGSAQTAGLWLGSNSGNKAKMTLGNGSLTEASGIASAIGVKTTDTYYAAMICRTNLSKVYKVTLTYTTPGGTAPSEAWILYSTDNGSTWSVGKKVTSLNPTGTDFVFDNTITSAARYAFVIHCTNYCQFKVPVLTFYEGTTGGGCSNAVALSKGTATNGTINTISSASVETCSATASDRRVTVTITPEECYNAPSDLTWTKTSGTVSASKQSGPTDNGDGTYSYVYQFEQNNNGAGTFGVTCTAKAAGKTVNFNAGPGSCGTSSLTETCDGSGVTLPAVTASGICKGWTTFAGWATAAVNDSSTTSVTVYAADSKFVPASNGQTLYAVYSKNKSGGNSSVTIAPEDLDVTSGNAIDGATVGTITFGGAKGGNGSASNVPKYYSGTPNTIRCYASNDFTISSTNTISQIDFTYNDSYTGGTISLSTGSWAATPTINWDQTWTGSATSITFRIGSTAWRITSIKVTTGGGATTYYCSDPNCCTALGSINGSVSWSSTSATLTWDDIANVNSWAVACKNTSTGIAAGTVGSITTNGAGKKTCTITDLTCGGTGYTFTISATAASGYCDKSWELTGSTTACTDPAITVSPASLTGLDYIVGNGPSTAQSFTVSGANLSANLVVSAPANYEVCKTADGTYTSTISYTPSDGTVTDQTVYIRLKAGLNVGAYNYAAASGVSAASTGATTRTAALTGSVTKAAGAIAFTDFNAGDHYEAEWTGSAILVPYNYILTGDGTLTTTKVDGRGGTVDTENKKWSLTNEGTYQLRLTLGNGTNYTGAGPVTADFVIYKADRFYDNLHGNDVIVKRNDTGEDHYTIPSLTDESRQTSGSCSETHYHFMGWVPESALSTLSNDAAYDAVMITGGGTQAASGTNYYAVWAEE